MLLLFRMIYYDLFLLNLYFFFFFFFFSSRRRHTRFDCDWSSDVCSSDLESGRVPPARPEALALRRLEGVAEPYPRVRHRDHDYPLRELAAPAVRLHRHPAARADRKSVV